MDSGPKRESRVRLLLPALGKSSVLWCVECLSIGWEERGGEGMGWDEIGLSGVGRGGEGIGVNGME